MERDSIGTNVMRNLLLAGVLCGLGSSACKANDAAKLEFFETKIRPVLVEHCTGCHNSLDKKKGGLALDYRQGLLDGGDSGEIIVPGKPDESVLLWALQHKNGYEMPANSPRLEKAIIEDFAHWIRTGAYDPRLAKPTQNDLQSKRTWSELRQERRQWWSFQPLHKPMLPDVADPDWSRSAVDRFVFAWLQQNDLTPQPLADAETLIRRVTLILTGLPPKPEQTAKFLANPTEEAYRELVDELLASPEFGERWARHWMDWYRYAESHGSEGDPPIPHAGQYREYLIRALNADVPYDQLLIEHLAGDLLEHPRLNDDLKLNESAIGPAHLRMVPHGFGVTDAYGEQITFTDNQIDVISKAMFGLTVSCARCHNHKFDPISQKDFYRLFGVMMSSRPSMVLINRPQDLQRNKNKIRELKPRIRKQLADVWLSELDQLPARIAAVVNRENADTSLASGPLDLFIHLRKAPSAPFRAVIDRQLKEIKRIEQTNARRISEAKILIDFGDPAAADQWFVSGNSSADSVSPAGSFALASDGANVVRGIYPGGVYSHLESDRHAAVLSTKSFTAQGKGTWARVMGSKAEVRVPVRNYALSHGGLHRPTNLESVSFPRWEPVRTKWDYWQDEVIHYELRTGADVIPKPNQSERSFFGITEIYAGDAAPETLPISLLRVTKDVDAIRDLDSLNQAYRKTLKRIIRQWRDGELQDVEAEFLNGVLQLNLLANDLNAMPAPLQELVGEYRRLESEIPRPRRAPGVLDVNPTPQPLLVRGDQNQEAEPVPHGFLEVFSEEPFQNHRPARLQLAERIVGEANTLKSRVLINRLWAYCFGRGLVSSTDNFGRLGSKPTHPELLDFLALDFERNGWSIKHALRQIVTSRAFCQANSASAETLERDPNNEWLSYFRPRRLDAEAIYDSIGQLAGHDRRAIHLPVIRNRLDPFLTVFNAPVPISTVGSRTHTDVPAQYLALMNGSLVENAADAWSKRIVQDAALKTSAEKITAMFRQIYARNPRSDELQVLQSYRDSREGLNEQLVLATRKIDQTHRELAQVRDAREEWVDPIRRQHEPQADDEEVIDLKPIAQWDFEGDATDAIGGLQSRLVGDARIHGGCLELRGGCLLTSPINQPIQAKTLESLIQLDRLDQRGGGAMSVQTLDGNLFDSIVYAEAVPQRWLAGSDHFRRTVPLEGTPESQANERFVHLVFAYDANGTIRTYRNGVEYGKPFRKTEVQPFYSGNIQVIFGLRHGTKPTGGRMLTGRIEAARLYDRALTSDEVQTAFKMIPNRGLTDDEIVAELTPAQKELWQRQSDEIRQLQTQLDVLRKHHQDLQNSPLLRNDGYYAIGHVLMNSKEFLYVP